jgi:hypothetical protein
MSEGGRGIFFLYIYFFANMTMVIHKHCDKLRVKGSIQFEFYEVKTTRKLDMGDMTS